MLTLYQGKEKNQKQLLINQFQVRQISKVQKIQTVIQLFWN